MSPRPPRALRPSTAAAFLASACIPTIAALAQNCPTRWDTTPGTQGINGTAYAALPLPSGDVIVGGNFTMAGGVAAGSIARYHPATNTWSRMGAGLRYGTSIVGALTRAQNGDIIAGGYFNDNTSLRYIARWSDSTATWSPLGPGLSGNVHALLTMPDGTILAGGNFYTTGTGQPLNRVARFDPQTSTWSSWPFGFADIYAMALAPNGDVYAGGGDSLKRLNAATNTWSTVTTPSISSVFAFGVAPNGDLLVPGNGFITGFSTIQHGIWRFNKVTGIGTPMGAFTGANVGAIGTTPAGDIYAYGYFQSPSPSSFSKVVHWNASAAAWDYLATSPNVASNSFDALDIATLPNGDLFFAGEFTSIGAAPASNVAILTSRPICAADFNCSGSLDTQDVIDFLTAWFNNDVRASMSRSPGVQVQDIFDFLTAWFIGC